MLQPMHQLPVEGQRMAMKNTARIPIFGHHPKDQDVLWDGGMLAGIPAQEAMELGATHVLVVRCQPAGFKKEWPSFLDHGVLQPMLWKHKDLQGLLRRRLGLRAKAIKWLAEAGPEVMVLAVPKIDIGRTEVNEGKLFRQLVSAYSAAGPVLGFGEAALPPEWKALAEEYL
ncbi:MAG: hypothetical protein GC129_02195 [Proteobacteria bacterium]|nr:hypothetical protein [Pseudomonadota bacterium]